MPTLSKVFERHLADQINSYLHKTGIIHELQSGFRAKHSCQTALTRIIDDWLDAMDNGQYVGALFLDLKKAFDLVDHDILCYKLRLYKFDCNTVNLISTYLKSRHQIVQDGNIKSSRRLITSGVPQGSILGPILFILYINDLSFEIENTIIDMYADDGTIYSKHKELGKIELDLQLNLNAINKWCFLNNMAINAQKTKCMVLGSNFKLRNAKPINIVVNSVSIENVTSKKLLGITLDSTLSWKAQVNSVTKKVNSKIALLKRINYFLNDDMRKMFYNAYIVPLMDYCCSIWGKTLKCHIDKMTILQKRVAKTILFKPIRTPSRELFLCLDWLTFENRCKYQTALLVYKSLNRLTPKYMDNIVQLAKNKTYGLRSASRKDISHVRYKTSYKKQSFSCHSTFVWNSLPDSLRTSKTVSSFKRNSKLFLLKQQQLEM